MRMAIKKQLRRVDHHQPQETRLTPRRGVNHHPEGDQGRSFTHTSRTSRHTRTHTHTPPVLYAAAEKTSWSPTAEGHAQAARTKDKQAFQAFRQFSMSPVQAPSNWSKQTRLVVQVLFQETVQVPLWPRLVTDHFCGGALATQSAKIQFEEQHEIGRTSSPSSASGPGKDPRRRCFPQHLDGSERQQRSAQTGANVAAFFAFSI